MNNTKYIDSRNVSKEDIELAWQKIDCRSLLAHTSRDLRSSLSNVLGLAELAKLQIDDKEYVEYCMEKVEDTTHYLLNLINDILYTISPETENITRRSSSFNILELFENVSSVVRPIANGKKLHFHTQVGDNVAPYIISDRGRIQQILQNLLSNAVKFTPRYGKIDFQLHQLAEYDNKARIEFVVRDTGIGISPEVQENIFLPMTKEYKGSTTVYGGVGLGLAICYKLTDYLGGRLEFRSTKEHGTEFRLHLDLEIDQEMSSASHAWDNHGYNFAGKTVLLADDDEINCEIAKSLLTRRGLIVDTAENGKVALSKYMMNAPGAYDLILMNVRMPLMDGLEATRRIRASAKSDAKRVPIIAMTANAYAKDIQRSIEAGMDAHLTKPVETGLLYETLQRALDGEL